ncbi:2,3-bisphosphoglycerate-dependent phosphoglycerate mutase [uncultured archaeon]|nr:2,3-bisphosphoglycerate-dependent phosphoglycerate mutase [uncultured archaeon]
MLRILLVRHGETDHNVAGLIDGHGHGKLTRKGVAQTKALAQRLRREKIDAIYTSDLERSHQTALALAKFHPHLKIVVTRLVRERMFGAFEGQNFMAFVKRYPTYMKNSKRIQNVKTSGQLRKRAKRFLEFLVRTYDKNVAKTTTVLVVGHGVFNNALIAALTNTGVNRPWFQQDNTCVNLLERDNVFGCWVIRYLNDTRHLTGRLR